MTPKIIELKQAPVVLVELPERESIGKLELKWDSPLMGGNHKVHLLNNRRYIGTLGLAKHFNDDSILGILSDLTEEQFAGCVASWGSVCNDGSKVYENYKDSIPKNRTAKNSFYSLLESENVYTENPYKHPRDMKATPQSFGWYKDAVRSFEEAQSRTIDPKRTVVLIRKEDK